MEKLNGSFPSLIWRVKNWPSRVLVLCFVLELQSFYYLCRVLKKSNFKLWISGAFYGVHWWGINVKHGVHNFSPYTL